MTRITPQDVRKVSKLARLEITDEQVQNYANTLEKILEYVAQLEKIDTTGVPPTTRAVEVTNVTRDDIVESSEIRENLIDLAPQREDEFYKVPKIMSD